MYIHNSSINIALGYKVGIYLAYIYMYMIYIFIMFCIKLVSMSASYIMILCILSFQYGLVT